MLREQLVWGILVFNFSLNTLKGDIFGGLTAAVVALVLLALKSLGVLDGFARDHQFAKRTDAINAAVKVALGT